ncbi:MAG TPA: EVE domain-containing protein [Candidatus Limnocylindrales bacterium]|nr:EVE domain-containing protein [Candidatus Limnocylindrales bacterium]
MAHYWLLKTEPDEYSYDDLEKDGKTIWDGVSNNLALKYLRQIRQGDLAFIYHTGNEKALVGIAEIISDPYPDPSRQNQKLVVVDVKPRERLPRSVSLVEIKNRPEFADFELVKLPRLSVMPVTEVQWKQLLSLAGGVGS